MTAPEFDAQNLRFNEFVSENTSGITDEDGDLEDWVELYNSGASPVNLLQYTISDDLNEPMKWGFPNISIEPGEFLLVFCSGKDRLWGPYLHTNFRIKQSGEPLLLSDNEGNLIDFIHPTPLGDDYSYARVIDGNGYWERYDSPTPGASNALEEVVRFSHPPGYHAGPINLALQTPSNLAIRYTTNGSLPTATSDLYNAPIALSVDNLPEPVLSQIVSSPDWSTPSEVPFMAHTIRAQAFDGDEPVTGVFTRTFFIGNEVIDRYEGYPVVSIVTDPANLFDYETGIYTPGTHFSPTNPVWTGNYFQRGSAWERDVHLEFFEEGALAWSQNAGMRIHGGKTRNQPQKSLRLYARGDVGANKFHHRIFETRDKEVFERLILRAHFGCWNKTMIKDPLSAYVARDLDFDSQHARPAIVLINGEYWGIHTFRDHLDHHFFSEQYAIEEDSVDILLHGSGTNPNWGSDWGIVQGDNSDYLAMLDFIENNPLEVPENYEFVKTKLDVKSMVEFYCTAIYLSQYDWPSNNHKVWKGRGLTKWRWMMYDFDSAWGYRPFNFNTLSYASHPTGSSIYNTPYTTFLFRELLTSEEFRQTFLQTYACLMNSVFLPENLEASVDHFVALYAEAVPEHLNRWNNLGSPSNWMTLVNTKLYDFAAARREHAIEHVNVVFGIVFNPDDYECEDEDEDEDEEPTIVSETHKNEPLRVYPNPTREGVWVDAENSATNAELLLFNTVGQLIYTTPYRFHTYLDLSDLPAGVYLARVIENGHHRSARIVCH